jgi:hypothetical protein
VGAGTGLVANGISEREITRRLSILDLSDDLRGERLCEIAADVVWRQVRDGDVNHYKQWFDLVVADGHRIVATTIGHVPSFPDRTSRSNGWQTLRLVSARRFRK